MALLDRAQNAVEELYRRQAPRRRTRVPERRRGTRRPVHEPLVQYRLNLAAEEAARLRRLVDELKPGSVPELITEIVRLGLEPTQV